MQVRLLPGEGIEVDGKKLLLGDTLAEAEAVLGKPANMSGISFFCAEALAVDIDKDGRIRYIECRRDTGAEIYGVSAFDTDAGKLYDILKDNNGADILDPEDGHGYMFERICVSVWRETTPGEVNEMIAEAEEDGEPMSDEDIAEEMYAAEHWDTIGVYIPGYYGN